ncbi:unnamed protein product, partial [marine sediment metagenome]
MTAIKQIQKTNLGSTKIKHFIIRYFTALKYAFTKGVSLAQSPPSLNPSKIAMMPIQDNNYQRIYDYLINIGLILSITLLMYLILFSITFLSLEGPQEYRENAITFTTHLLLKGANPYSLENLPTYLNAYGIVYNLI